MGNKVYTVQYRVRIFAKAKECTVRANNKADAYAKAAYEVIPYNKGEPPYSAWVHGVRYSNGNYHTFNTCEGLPY